MGLHIYDINTYNNIPVIIYLFHDVVLSEDVLVQS